MILTLRIILILFIIAIFYTTYRTSIKNIAFDQYKDHVSGKYKGDNPQWAEIQFMNIRRFEIGILHKMGVIK